MIESSSRPGRSRLAAISMLVCIGAACGSDQPAGPTDAERIAQEAEILAPHRDALIERLMWVVALSKAEAIAEGSTHTAVQNADPALDPLPRYGGGRTSSKNVFFFWAMVNGKQARPFPDDRNKLIRLCAIARGKVQPKASWPGKLEKDIAHVLARHVAVAIPVEFSMPKFPDKSASEFIGGVCRAQLRIFDGNSKQVVARGACAAQSSEEIRLMVKRSSSHSQTRMLVAYRFQRKVALTVSRAFQEIGGGSWMLGE